MLPFEVKNDNSPLFKSLQALFLPGTSKNVSPAKSADISRQISMTLTFIIPAKEYAYLIS